MPRLESLGERICIFGPSNAGKSSLAAAIGQKLGFAVVHLDQLRHLPHTDWQVRPDEEFAALHAAAITGERWVMDGNYSKLTPARMGRATGMIVLDMPWPANLARYFRRTLLQPRRVGALEGGRDSVKLEMIKWIAWRQPRSRARQQLFLSSFPLPRIDIAGWSALQQFYRDNGLPRPGKDLMS